MAKLTVTNTARNTVERAGILFPARATVTVEVSDSRLAEVKAATMLKIVQDKAATVTEGVGVTDPDLRATAEDSAAESELETLTVPELKERATAEGIDAGNLKKGELLAALRAKEESRSTPTVVGGVER